MMVKIYVSNPRWLGLMVLLLLYRQVMHPPHCENGEKDNNTKKRYFEELYRSNSYHKIEKFIFCLSCKKDG